MKTNNSRKGFSLVETIMVIAIIVILLSATAFSLLNVVKNLPWQELIGENPFSTSVSK